MDEQTLEPCPFCGEDGACVEDAGEGYAYVLCVCTVNGPMRQGEAEAITAWNRRAAHSVIAGKVAELEAEFRFLDGLVDRNIKESDGPDRVKYEGVWHEGPLATAYLKTLRAIQKLARAALAPYPERRSE